jgi:hypothetical protein
LPDNEFKVVNDTVKALPTTSGNCEASSQDVTAVMSPEGNVSTAVPLLGNIESVLNETASALDAPGALPVMDKALEAVAATHPMQGVST